MERAARLRFYEGSLPYFLCWARDCPLEFGRIVPGDTKADFCTIFLPLFVWSRKERLYLIPKSENIKGRRIGQEFPSWAAIENEVNRRHEAYVLEHGEEKRRRFEGQVMGELIQNHENTPFSWIPTDGRRVRVRCPLCNKVSILSLAAKGALVSADETGRETEPNNGHLKPLQAQRPEPP